MIERIWEKLREVKDPEVGRSIVELGLVDEVRYENGVVYVTFHPTTPFCPSTLSVQMGVDIYVRVSELEGVRNAIVRIKDHAYEKLVNELIDLNIRKISGP
ncbi:MAG: metal-sulfur cluster assembly factor [Candidatus Methanodesulfokora sp.]|nr:MAG: hypothetical protein C0200_00150 [Candidatus Korarchaeota archaeon]